MRALDLGGDFAVGNQLRRGNHERDDDSERDRREAHAPYGQHKDRNRGGRDDHRLPGECEQAKSEAEPHRAAALHGKKRQRHERDRGDEVVERQRRDRNARQYPHPSAEARARQSPHRKPAECQMQQEVEVEGHVRRQQQIKEVVGIERQRVRIAGQRLAAAVGEVPPRDLAGAKRGRGEDLDRVVRREVVAEKEEPERRRQHENAASRNRKRSRGRTVIAT